MKNILDNFEKEQIKKLTSKKNIPNFRVGDTVKVNIKVTEGERSRIQAFEGVCIAKKNAGLNSSLTVRKISYGEGIERVFPFFSPTVDSIQIIKQGDVRRGKLYYLRERSGKNTRIADKNRGDEKDLYELSENVEEKDENKVTKEENKKDIKDQVVSEEIKKTEATKNQETKTVEAETDESKVEVEKPNNESKS